MSNHAQVKDGVSVHKMRYVRKDVKSGRSGFFLKSKFSFLFVWPHDGPHPLHDCRFLMQVEQ